MTTAPGGNRGSFLPCAELLRVLRPAYKCRHFASACKAMKWIPEDGHVPRGFCGALGKLDDVELVLVLAEPGEPQDGESHVPDKFAADRFIESVCEYACGCFERCFEGCFARDQDYKFHRKIRREILDRCWPGLKLIDQMRRTWITESVLCSASKESGHISTAVSRCCADLYLREQLLALPHATTAILGDKAKARTTRLEHELQREFIYAKHPVQRGSLDVAREGWRQIADEVRRRARKRGN